MIIASMFGGHFVHVPRNQNPTIFVEYPSALRFLNTDSVAMWLRPPLLSPYGSRFWTTAAVIK
jgi:hypothetical protein